MGTMLTICTTCLLICLQCSTSCAICDETITSKLKSHLISNSLKFFTGQFTDVWVSKHLTEVLNCSRTEVHVNGTTTSYVLYNDGTFKKLLRYYELAVRGFSASGKISQEDNGILNIQVDSFHMTGLLFPIFASSDVVGYYSCYPGVAGAGVSVITVRSECGLRPDTVRQVLEAKMAFRHLQELGIPVNDGVDYQ